MIISLIYYRLVDETVVTSVASNPTVQKAAKAAVTTAIKEETSKFTTNSNNNNETSWNNNSSKGDLEAPLNPEPYESEGSSQPEPLNIPPEELKQIEKWHLILRVSYMAISILMATAAVLALENASLGTFFIALYVFAFAVIICCFELSLKGIAVIIAENLGFLYTKTGRMIFMVFIAVMCFDLKIIGKVTMAILLLAVCVNLYVFFTFPKYEVWLRRKHFSEILDKKR